MINTRVISALAAVLILTSCALRAQQGTLRGERVIVTNKDSSVYPPNDVIIRTSGLDNRILMGIGVSDDAIIQLYNDSNNKMIEISTIESFNMLSLSTDPGVEKVAAGIVVGGTALDMGALQVLGEDRASGLDAYTSIQGGDMTSNTLLVRTTNVGPGYVQWDDTSGTGGLVTVNGYNGSGASYQLYWPGTSYASASCGGTCVIEIDDSTGQMSFAASSGASSSGTNGTIQLSNGSGGFTSVTNFRFDGAGPSFYTPANTTFQPSTSGTGQIGTAGAPWDQANIENVIVGSSLSNGALDVKATTGDRMRLTTNGTGLFLSDPDSSSTLYGFYLLDPTSTNNLAVMGMETVSGSTERGVIAVGEESSSAVAELRPSSLKIANGANQTTLTTAATGSYSLALPMALPGSTQCLQLTSGGQIQTSGAACGGGGSLPVVDSTVIVTGSSDVTKQMRFEIDGFTAGATRILTIQDANQTLAGTNLTNTWTATQNMRSINFGADNTYTIGSSGGNRPAQIYGYSVVLGKSGVANGNIQLQNTSGVGVNLNMGSGGFTIDQSLLPASPGTYSLGGASSAWFHVYSAQIHASVWYSGPLGGIGTTTVTTLTCGTGEAIKSINVDGGIVTSVSCGTP